MACEVKRKLPGVTPCSRRRGRPYCEPVSTGARGVLAMSRAELSGCSRRQVADALEQLQASAGMSDATRSALTAESICRRAVDDERGGTFSPRSRRTVVPDDRLLLGQSTGIVADTRPPTPRTPSSSSRSGVGARDDELKAGAQDALAVARQDGA